MAADRYLTFDLQRNYYYETHDERGNVTSNETEAQWRQRILNEWSPATLNCDWAVIGFHDKDTDEHGIRRGLHAHGVVHRLNGTSPSAMLKASGCSSEENCQHSRSKVKSLRYLLHITEPALNAGKWIYDVDEAIVLTDGNCDFDFRAELAKGKDDEDESKEKQREFKNRCSALMMTGEATLPQIRQRYAEGTLDLDLLAWKRDRAGYDADLLEGMADKARWYETNPRCLTSTYIQGEGERGKTDLALALAASKQDAHGIHRVGTRGKDKTFDLAGKYRGQAVSVINELQGSALTPDEFCDLFDPTHATIANSRNVDKPWFASWSFITTARHLEGFVWDMYQPYAAEMVRGRPDGRISATPEQWQRHYESVPDVADKIRQCRRRIAVWIELLDLPTDDAATEYVPAAVIRVRNDAVNPPHCYHLPAEQETYARMIDNGEGMFLNYRALRYASADDLPAIVAAWDEAVRYYYELNDYSVTPWNTPAPQVNLPSTLLSAS